MNSTLGVDIDSVWQQGSLMAQPPPAPKKSKYDVPILDARQRQQMMEQFSNNQVNPQQYQEQQAFQHYQHQQPYSSQVASVPISVPEHPQMMIPAQTHAPVNLSEIPYLKEQLSNQSNTVSDCQKDMAYMKAVIQQLKRELYESRYSAKNGNKDEKRRRWGKFLWMIGVLIALIGLLIMVVQIHQKVNRLLSHPLM